MVLISTKGMMYYISLTKIKKVL